MITGWLSTCSLWAVGILSTSKNYLFTRINMTKKKVLNIPTDVEFKDEPGGGQTIIVYFYLDAANHKIAPATLSFTGELIDTDWWGITLQPMKAELVYGVDGG